MIEVLIINKKKINLMIRKDVENVEGQDIIVFKIIEIKMINKMLIIMKMMINMKMITKIVIIMKMIIVIFMITNIVIIMKMMIVIMMTQKIIIITIIINSLNDQVNIFYKILHKINLMFKI